MHQETPFKHHLTSSQDLNDTPFSVMNIILYPVANYCKTSVFVQCFYQCIFSGAGMEGVFRVFSSGRSEQEFLMGIQSHFNVPQEHVTAVPLFHPWPS